MLLKQQNYRNFVVKAKYNIPSWTMSVEAVIEVVYSHKYRMSDTIGFRGGEISELLCSLSLSSNNSKRYEYF